MIRLALAALVGVAPATSNAPSTPTTDALAQVPVLEEPSPLEWSAPASCPSGAQVWTRVLTLTGSRPDVTARADVTRVGARWRLELRVRWQDGSVTRALDSASCVALADAAALLIAVLADPLATSATLDAEGAHARRPEPATTPPARRIDRDASATLGVASVPLATAGTSAPEPASAGTTQSALGTTRPTRATARPRDPPGASPRDRGFGVRVFAGVDLGSLPSAAPVFGLGLTRRWPAIRVGLDGVYLPPSRVELSAPAGDGAVQLGVVRGELCPRLYAGPVELPLCAAIEGGASRAAGFGPSSDRSALSPWAAAAFGIELRERLARRLALFLRVDAVIPLVLTSYQYEGVELHRAASASARASLGLSFSWAQRNLTKPENSRVP